MSDEITAVLSVNNDFIDELKGNRVKTILSTVVLVFWILFMSCIWVLVKLILPNKLNNVFIFFHRVCCRIFSIRCQIVGAPTPHQPTLFLANHISYLDIFIFGSVIPGYFIAKSEVANWPILGLLAKMQHTLFFERNGRKVRGQLQVMSEHFEKRGNLILFPEGTSTEGEHVERFKSSLLQSLEETDADVQIQPVTIAYTHYNKKTMSRSERDAYAWYDTMPFASHFFNVLGLKQSRVQVRFHLPVTLDEFTTRKPRLL